MNDQFSDRVKGVLMGLAAGDRIGGPTHMATLLGESLVESSAFDIHDVGKRYFAWWVEDGFDVGIVCERVFSLVAGGTTLNVAVDEIDLELNGMTAGCNPVHRSMPIAMATCLPDDEIVGIAEKESLLTHKHHDAGQVSSAGVQLARELIRGTDWFDAIEKLGNTSSPIICDALKEARKGKILPDGYSPHVFGAAIHFVSFSNYFDEMLERATDFSGDENYSAVLAGSFGGARWGASSISDFWFAGLKDKVRLNFVADCLSKDW